MFAVFVHDSILVSKVWNLQQTQDGSLRIIPVESPGENVQKLAALVGGSADLAAETAGELLLAVAESGVDLRFVAGAYEYTESQLERAKTPTLENGSVVIEGVLVAAPGVAYTEPADLVGKRIGIGKGPGMLGWGIVRAVEAAGLDPEKIEWIEGAISERIALFKRGDLDFANLTGAFALEAIDGGGSIAFYPGTYIYEPGTVMTWYTTADIANQKYEQIKAFKAAVIEINTLLNDPGNLEEFRRFLVEDYGLEPAVVERFTMAKLVGRDISIDEYSYMIPILQEQGSLRRDLVLTPDLIFK